MTEHNTSSGNFSSFFMGGFECSTHRLRSSKRLDLIAQTRHDEFAERDYLRLRDQEMGTARDGVRWHLIEKAPYQYDFSSLLPMLRAARKTGVQVIWDLMHYGYPDDIDLFSAEFVTRFGRFAQAVAHVLRDETEGTLFVSPVNEISFFTWGAGDVGYLNPFATHRGDELKAQLIRACVEAIEAVWSVDPNARIVHPDPVIHIASRPERPQDKAQVEGMRLGQFQSWDMIAGRQMAHLGGQSKYLDILGLNYYIHNQRIHDSTVDDDVTLKVTDALYRPFSDILREVHTRYQRPLFIAETGIEDEARPTWLRYICNEVRSALRAGVPVEGICLYPILEHPGWDQGHHRYNGLWGYAEDNGDRPIYQPLADELQQQKTEMKNFFQALHTDSVDDLSPVNAIETVDAGDFAGQAEMINDGVTQPAQE